MTSLIEGLFVMYIIFNKYKVTRSSVLCLFYFNNWLLKRSEKVDTVNLFLNMSYLVDLYFNIKGLYTVASQQ